MAHTLYNYTCSCSPQAIITEPHLELPAGTMWGNALNQSYTWEGQICVVILPSQLPFLMGRTPIWGKTVYELP